MARRKHPPPAQTPFWIGYCRKSTDTEDKQIHTLQDQATMIQGYYDRLPPAERERRPLKLLREAQSAYRPGRPVFQSILQLASRGLVHGVIVVHPNRISRNHSDSGAFVQRLVDGQIACLDTTGGKRYTGADSNDIFMLTLEGAMSWKDSRDKGDRILQAMRMRATEGRHMGQLRTGYQRIYRPDGTKLIEVVPETAPLVRRLFTKAATGNYSLQDLVNEAWMMDLRSRNGNKLLKSVIHEMLRDPVYKGYIRFDGIETRGTHEPIVDEAVWTSVQLVLSGRRKESARPQNLTLRDLFVFGNLLRCPKCRRSLCAYRAKGQYVYYECKNPEAGCRVIVSQAALLKQFPERLTGLFTNKKELDELREKLVQNYRKSNGAEIGRRRALNEEYEHLQREIGDLFARRKEAEAQGVLDAVDLRINELKQRRDVLSAQLNRAHDRGTNAIEKVIRAFELVNLLEQAILTGERPTREPSVKAITSNCSLEGKELVLELRSPFRQKLENPDRPLWYTELDDVRTEIEETVELLEQAYSLIQALSLVRSM